MWIKRVKIMLPHMPVFVHNYFDDAQHFLKICWSQSNLFVCFFTFSLPSKVMNVIC